MITQHARANNRPQPLVVYQGARLGLQPVARPYFPYGVFPHYPYNVY
jgi:hypothetical protein